MLYVGIFQRHYGFSAMLFNELAKDASSKAQYISLNFRKTAIECGLISKSNIKKCIRYQQDVQVCKKRGLKVICYFSFSVSKSLFISS